MEDTVAIRHALLNNHFPVSAWDNMKLQADIADRRSFDEDVFRKAGQQKPPRTYKFDPTKSRVISKIKK